MSIFARFSGEKRPRCTAVIVAAGSATRMQGTDKIMADLAGEPVIVHTVRAFENAACIDEIVVVARQDRLEEVQKVLQSGGFSKLTAVVPGGETRMDSVEAGLKAADRNSTLVAVQDGARPMVTGEIIGAAVQAATRCHAAAPGIPVKDTVKVIDGDNKVVSTPQRSALRAVQTPQVFDRDLLQAAWQAARQQNQAYTDDCGAMEGIGMRVYMTEGSEENLKITTPFDLQVAELIMRGRK